MKSWTWILIVVMLSSNLVGCNRKPLSLPGENGDKSELSAPSQKKLNEVLSKLKTIRLLDCNMDKAGNLIDKKGKKVMGTGDAPILYESSEPQVLKDLAQYLLLRDNEEVDKSLYGTLSKTNLPTLELTISDGRVVHLGIIDGKILRWKEWRHEAVLKRLAFVLWLARHGVGKPALDIKARLEQAISDYEKKKRTKSSKDYSKQERSQDETSFVVSSVVTPKSKLLVPSQKILDDVLSKLKTFRIIETYLDSYGDLKGRWITNITGNRNDFVIFESSDPKELNILSRVLQIEDDSKIDKSWRVPFYNTVEPSLQLILTDGRVVYLGINGGILRCKEWRNEAFLKDVLEFDLWLARHGVIGPAMEFIQKLDYSIYEHEKYQGSYEQFVQNMPKSLSTFLGRVLNLEWSPNLENMSSKYGQIPEEQRLQLSKLALSKEFPREAEQIAVLLEWKGKFLIDWAGGYQSFPTDLLMEYEPSHVMSVVKSSRLTTAQWIGLCRYYSAYDFRQKFPSGYKPLDKRLQQRIIKEVRSTGRNDYDVDKFNNALENWKS